MSCVRIFQDDPGSKISLSEWDTGENRVVIRPDIKSEKAGTPACRQYPKESQSFDGISRESDCII
jgi:hypothetical protein